MAQVSTYINFPRTTEAAFNFYKTVFGMEFSTPIGRYSDMPRQPGQPELAEADKNLVMHVALPILGGHVLMGTDVSESRGFNVKFGNNMFINLETGTRTESNRIFKLLAAKGKVDTPLLEMFWGAYFGILADQLGVGWMFNCNSKN